MKNQKKILLLCQHFYPEMVSTGMHMTELSETLNKKGVKITAFCAPPSYDLDEWKGSVPRYIDHKGIQIYRAQTRGKPRKNLLHRFIFALSYLLSTLAFAFKNRGNFDGYIVGTNPPFLGIVSVILKKMFDVKYILIVYDVYPEYAVKLGVIREDSIVARIWYWITKLIINNAVANVVIGRDMRRLIKAKLNEVNEENIYLIPNWSDEDIVKPDLEKMNEFRQEVGIENQFLVLYSGTMNKSHNLEPLLDAAELLEDEPFQFVFVGEGSNKKNLQTITEEKGLKNVQFLPFQPKNKLPEVLASCDISVVCLNKKFTGLSVPSKTYGIMAAGRPIMAFLEEQSEIGLTIKENNCGIVIEEPKGELIVEKLRQLKSNNNFLKKMSSNSYKAFKEKYTLNKSSEKYLNLILEKF